MEKKGYTKARSNKQSKSNKFEYKVTLKGDVFAQIIRYKNENGDKKVNIISDKHDSKYLYLGNIGCIEDSKISLRKVIAINELKNIKSNLANAGLLDNEVEELIHSEYADNGEAKFVVSNLLRLMTLLTDEQCLVTSSAQVLMNLFQRDALLIDSINLNILISMISDKRAAIEEVEAIVNGVFPVIKLVPNYESGKYIPMISTITCWDGDFTLGIFESTLGIPKEI